MNKDLIIIKNPKSPISENIRMVRTNIEFLSNDKESKSILITSSIAGEGKSFTSANLAASFAGMNKKTIIVDCDLRRGRLHNIFGLPNVIGLSKMLRDKEYKYVKEYINKTNIPNLDVITRGEVPDNPSELLNHEYMAKLTAHLKSQYDYVIFDGTPASGLSDSVIMSKNVDMVVLVASLKITSKDALKSTKKVLESVNANVVGVVVNRVPKEGHTYYDYK